jgi:hypothetical protein
MAPENDRVSFIFATVIKNECANCADCILLNAGERVQGDGKLSGREEYISCGEIFQFCGNSFYIDRQTLLCTLGCPRPLL